MDQLSKIIRLARLEGVVDVRCLLAGSFESHHPAAVSGEVPFHLVLEGRCRITTGGRTVDLAPGDLVLLPHGEAHRVTAAGDLGRPMTERAGESFATRRSVGAGPELDLFCGHYRHQGAAGALMFRLLPPLLHVSLDRAALTLAEVLRDEAQRDGPGTGAIVAGVLDAVLAMALRSRPEQRLGTPALWTAMGDDVLGRVIAGVVERPAEPWTTVRLAAAAAMSRATFNRRFTARTGTTVATLLTAIRMMNSADLLTSTDLSVDRVANEVGYRSGSAFGQAFKAALGTSPARYRRVMSQM
ncbi:cupin domain-containing protein [Microlunatus speluncae]|uniref:cupin domain-containing protein n=1 Tax=Microlunatus speluncae TaxID=2594267 RepID=UPI0012661380|nr:AraC family transcriptional regulator [Microlunatus speluncae]